MTTVAANKDMMCADTLIDDAGTRSKGIKVFQTKRAIIGVSGDYMQARRFVEWFADRRRVKPDPDAVVEILVLWPNGTMDIYFPDMTSMPVETEFWAIGSGRDAAIAAMKAGADPEFAVHIAAEVDMGTGIPVTRIDN